MRDLEKIKLDPQDEYLLTYNISFYKGYAFVYLPEEKKYDAIHRVIMGRKQGHEVDHVNRNKLDNRRSNLRFLTHQENLRNRDGWGRLPKGVYFDKTNKRKKPYKAMRRVDGKNVSYGYFATIQEAETALTP